MHMKYTFLLLISLSAGFLKAQDTLFVYDTLYVYDTVYIEEIATPEINMLSINPIDESITLTQFFEEDTATISIDRIIINESNQKKRLMKKKSILAVLLGLTIHTLWAQSEIGVGVTTSVNKEHALNDETFNQEQVFNPGIGAQVHALWSLGSRSLIKTKLSLQWVMANNSIKNKDFESFPLKYTVINDYLESRLLVAYGLRFGNFIPSIGLNLYHKQSLQTVPGDHSLINEPFTTYMMDVAGYVGLDYELNELWMLGMECSSGIAGANIALKDPKDSYIFANEVRNVQLGLSISRRFVK